MKMIKKFLALCLSMAMLLGLLTVSPAVQAAEEEGLTFAQQTTYVTTSPMDIKQTPRTYMARLNLPSSVTTTRGGIIFGNWGHKDSNHITFQVIENGVPRLEIADYSKSNAYQTYAFDQVQVNTGQWLDLSITIDETNINCYVNGEWKQSIAINSDSDTGKIYEIIPSAPMMVGGDFRGTKGASDYNTNYFRGQIASVAVYEDLRSEAEMQRDRIAPDYADPDLVCAYDLTQKADLKHIDLSTRKNHLTYTGTSSGHAGVTFGHTSDAAIKEGRRYVMDETPGAPIKTVESLVYLSQSLPNGFGGSIVSNYGESGTDIFRLQIDSNNPTLYLRKYGESTGYTVRFDQVAVCVSQWIHLAITIDTDTHAFRCYVDGKLAQTVVDETVPAVDPDMPLCVGGDYWTANDHIFRDTIASVTLYSDIRTAQEVQADAIALLVDDFDHTDPSLLACYDLSRAEDIANITDLSVNGNTLRRPFYTKSDETDYDYTFAVVGDTQNLVRYHADYVDDLYNWIANHAGADKQNIKFVFGLGDMTDLNLDSEWTTVKNNIDILKNAGIPFSMVRGNHDGNILMNQYFPYDEYGNTTGSAVSGCYDGSYAGNTYRMENYYQELVVGETKYLMLSLEYGAPDGVLAWANDVMAAYPDHQIIVTTHNFLDETGTLNDDIPQNTNADNFYPGYYGESANSSQDMWDECISKHQNVVLVMSGHVFWNNIRSKDLTGVYGNQVRALMINPQLLDLHTTNGTGLVALLHFSNGGKDVSVEYYSTVMDQHYNPINQFAFTLGGQTVAVIGEEEYSNIHTALDAADHGETVQLVADVESRQSALIIPNGVTVDLNGHLMQADNLLSFGNLIDSTQGAGGLVIGSDRTKAFMQLQTTNTALPLYDTPNGCYRFFTYTFEYKIKETTDTYHKYAFHLGLSNAKAYALLKDEANSELLSVRLQAIKNEDVMQTIDYTFMDSTLAAYADAAINEPNVKKAITLTVWGVDGLNGASMNATARLHSPTGVAAMGICENA